MKKVKKAAKQQQLQPQPIRIFFRPHDSGSNRVWRSDWASDQFEIMTEDELRTFIKLGARLSIYAEQAQED